MEKKADRTMLGVALMLVSSVCACLGQLCWKLSDLRPSQKLIYLLAGFALYGLGALFMLVAYRFGSLSVLQPIMCASYALSVVISAVVLNEAVTIAKIAGIAVITVGVIILSGGDKK